MTHPSLKKLRPEPPHQYFGHLMQRADSFENTLMLGKTEGRRREQRMRWLDAIIDSMDISLRSVPVASFGPTWRGNERIQGIYTGTQFIWGTTKWCCWRSQAASWAGSDVVMAGEVCQVSGARNSLLPLLTCGLWKPGCVCSYGTSSSFL